MVSDNGRQYLSQEMKDFAKTCGFKHITSSQHYPQGNGQAERTVRTVENLLKNKVDPYLTWCRLAPAELFMGRKLRTPLPMLKDFLKPEWKYLADFRKKKQSSKGNRIRTMIVVIGTFSGINFEKLSCVVGWIETFQGL